MNKIFLDDLPKKRWSNKEVINWENAKNKTVKFIYKNVEGELKIIKRLKNDKILIEYNNKEFKLPVNSLLYCQLGSLFSQKNGKFKISVGCTFEDDKRNIVIVDREYRQVLRKNGIVENVKWYKYKCNKCSNEDWIREDCLINKKQGCNVCSHSFQKVIKGYNDVATTHPHLLKYIINKEDAYKYSFGSKKKIKVKCPDCGYEKYMTLSYLSNRGFICDRCNNNDSYPNRLLFNLLNNLNMEFIKEYSPYWLKGKKFDFYIPSLNLIIEMDGGLGHGKNVYKNSNISKEESKQIDNWKDEQAIKHSLKIIRIDCDYRKIYKRFDYIKDSILSSELRHMLNLENVNWEELNIYSEESLMKKACKIKRKYPEYTVNDIAEILNSNKNTIYHYLKRGNELGLCDYNGQQYYKNKRNKIEVSKGNDILGVFESVEYLEENSKKLFSINLTKSGIYAVCSGVQKTHRGLKFKYV